MSDVMNFVGSEKNYYGVKQPQGFPGIPEGWITEWETRIASDHSTRLFVLLHRKKNGPLKRVLILVHGFGEHSGRYLHVPYFLEQFHSGVDAVFAYDQRGHGRSEGARGDVDHFDAFADDLEGMIRYAEAKFPEAELHLFGHSLGGLVCFRLGYLHPGLPLKTFQLSAPYLALVTEPSLAIRGIARILNKTWSTLSLSTDPDSTLLSRDERVVENHSADRLNHGRISPRFYLSLIASQRDTLARHDGFGYPLVIHLPLADPLVSTPVTRNYYEALSNPKGKRLFEYAGFRHEPANELGKEVFFENVSAILSGSIDGTGI